MTITDPLEVFDTITLQTEYGKMLFVVSDIKVTKQQIIKPDGSVVYTEFRAVIDSSSVGAPIEEQQ